MFWNNFCVHKRDNINFAKFFFQRKAHQKILSNLKKCGKQEKQHSELSVNRDDWWVRWIRNTQTKVVKADFIAV